MSFLHPHFSPAFRWGLVVLVLGGVVVWSSIHCLESSPLPPHLRSPPKGAWERVARRAKNALGDGLHLAGSGSNLVITRALAAAFREAYPNAHLVVHESIGSTGGVRAVLDGVITLGLIARPLRPHEMHPRLRVFPYARVPIAIIAHPDVRTPFITQDEMIATLQGEAKPWPDGTPRIWLLRERGDAGTEVLIRHIKGLREAMEEALSAKRFRVVYHDHELIRAVLGLRGSLGISDLPQVRVEAPTARIVAIDGRLPSPEGVRDGTYPFFKELSFVALEPIDELAVRFIEFSRSEKGRQIIVSMGALPWPFDHPSNHLDRKQP